MPTTKIIIFKHKAKKNKEAPLYLRVIKNRKIKYVSLSAYILPKYWDEGGEKVKPNHPSALRFNSYLAEKTRLALDSILESETDDPAAPYPPLKYSVLGSSPVDFFTYAYTFIKQYEDKGKIGTYRRFKAVLTKLETYIGEKKLEFSQLNLKFLKGYESNMRTKLKNKTNTVASNFKAIRRIVNEAIKDGVLPIKRDPFQNFKLTWEDSKRIYLTEEELASLENLDLVKDSSKYHHRNMYVFACYAGGIRISDLIQLRWANFNGTHIILNTQKTGSTVSIKLPAKALSILKLYQTKASKKEDYVFPFLDKSIDIKDPVKLHLAIASITTYTNTELKELELPAKIHKHLHFHTSRHTWATRALRKGMRIEYVSKLMGHNSIRTTQVYAKIVNADLDKAMDVFDETPEPPAEPTQKKKASS
jgi:integrase